MQAECMPIIARTVATMRLLPAISRRTQFDRENVNSTDETFYCTSVHHREGLREAIRHESRGIGGNREIADLLGLPRYVIEKVIGRRDSYFDHMVKYV